MNNASNQKFDENDEESSETSAVLNRFQSLCKDLDASKHNPNTSNDESNVKGEGTERTIANFEVKRKAKKRSKRRQKTREETANAELGSIGNLQSNLRKSTTNLGQYKLETNEQTNFSGMSPAYPPPLSYCNRG